jgi:hypothetical protein
MASGNAGLESTTDAGCDGGIVWEWQAFIDGSSPAVAAAAARGESGV